MLQEDITRILNSELCHEMRNHPAYKDYKIVKNGTEQGFRALYVFFGNSLTTQEALHFFTQGCKINKCGTLDGRFFIDGYFSIVIFS